MNKFIGLILAAGIGCAQYTPIDPLIALTEENNFIVFGEVKNVEVLGSGEAKDSQGTLMPVVTGDIEIDAEEVFRGPQEKALVVSFASAGVAPLKAGEKAVIFAHSSGDKPELTATVQIRNDKQIKIWSGITAQAQGMDISLAESLARIRKYVSALKGRL
jgi:hypothetical protein